MTPATATLRRAAQAFREHELTWGTGWFSQPTDNRCRCMGGAIAFALDPHGDDDPVWGTANPALGREAMAVLADYLITELGAVEARFTDEDRIARNVLGPRDVIETVGAWNDADGRTEAEVIDALEAAAAWAESQVAA